MTNIEQRVLLIGGPKHDEFMNLAKGQIEYEFTSMKTLMPPDKHDWSFWPESATHIYKLDRDLTMRFNADFNLFTHEVLWGSPYHGGFNLLTLTEALRTIEKVKTEVERARETQIMTSNKNRELEQECKDWQNKYEKLLELEQGLDTQLQKVRQTLELAATGIGTAIATTGRDYLACKSY